MAATVLNSPRAVEMSVYVVRVFTRLRAMLASNAELARKLDAIEKSVVVLDADSRRQFKELRAPVFSLAFTEHGTVIVATVLTSTRRRIPASPQPIDVTCSGSMRYSTRCSPGCVNGYGLPRYFIDR
jgi:hypothetical protein